MNNNPSSEEQLRKELASLGAREFEVVALTMEPDRGLSALRYAVEKGADYPISYAIKVFDNEDWQPSGEARRRSTNMSVDKKCTTCGGDRFIVHSTRKPAQTGWMRDHGIQPNNEQDFEEMKPCPSCNPIEVSMWRHDGTLVKTPR